MKPFCRHSLGLVLIAATAQPAAADVITDWNNTAVAVMKAANTGGNPSTRNLALMHVAMSDAVNSVQNRFAIYATGGAAAPGASPEAAAYRCGQKHPPATASQPEGIDRAGFRRLDQDHPRRRRQEGRHRHRRQVRARPSSPSVQPTEPALRIPTGLSPPRASGYPRYRICLPSMRGQNLGS